MFRKSKQSYLKHLYDFYISEMGTIISASVHFNNKAPIMSAYTNLRENLTLTFCSQKNITECCTFQYEYGSKGPKEWSYSFIFDGIKDCKNNQIQSIEPVLKVNYSK